MKRLIDELRKEKRIAWYPSAGMDYRELFYLSDAYNDYKNINSHNNPTCFVLTDYSTYHGEALLTGKQNKILYQDKTIKIEAVDVEELERLEIPFYEELVDFDKDEHYGRCFRAKIKISDIVLRSIETTLYYCYVENNSFALNYLLPFRLDIDTIIRIRYGAGFGGSKNNGDFLFFVMDELHTKYFIGRKSNITQLEWYPKFHNKSLFFTLNVRLLEERRLKKGLWDDTGDTIWYKVFKKNKEKERRMQNNLFDVDKKLLGREIRSFKLSDGLINPNSLEFKDLRRLLVRNENPKNGTLNNKKWEYEKEFCNEEKMKNADIASWDAFKVMCYINYASTHFSKVYKSCKNRPLKIDDNKVLLRSLKRLEDLNSELGNE